MAEKSILSKLRGMFIGKENKRAIMEKYPPDVLWADNVMILLSQLSKEKIASLNLLNHRAANDSVPNSLRYKIIYENYEINVCYTKFNDYARKQKKLPREGFDFAFIDRYGAWHGSTDSRGNLLELNFIGKPRNLKTEFKDYETVTLNIEK